MKSEIVDAQRRAAWHYKEARRLKRLVTVYPWDKPISNLEMKEWLCLAVKHQRLGAFFSAVARHRAGVENHHSLGMIAKNCGLFPYAAASS